MGRRIALLEKGILVAWVISLALGTRYVFGQPQDFGANQQLEYTRIFVPLSALLSVALIVVLRRYAPRLSWRSYGLLLALVLIIGLGAARAIRPDLSVWWFLLLSTYALATALVVRFCRVSAPARSLLLATVTSIAVVEASLGLLQLVLGHTLGLSRLGEPVATDQTLGVAKIVINGIKLLRPMGTLPHANVYGGFLVVGLLAASFATVSRHWSSALAYKLVIGLLLLGIAASFSRTAWLAAVLAICVSFILIGRKRRWHFAAAVTPAILLIAVWIPLIDGRFALSEQTQQLSIRSNLAGEAASLAAQHPFVGLGLRNFVPVLESSHPDWFPFELQPAHNVLLLLMAEIGVAGVSILVLLIGGVLVHAYRLIAAAGLITLLPILLFDHYLVALPQGLGILCLFLIILSLHTVSRETAST